MTTQDWINLIACVGELAATLLVALRAVGGPLALNLVFLSLDFFAWNFAQLAYHRTHLVRWHLLDMMSSPLASALAFHFLILFLGKSRQLRWLLRAIYFYYGFLAAAAAAGLVWADARSFALSGAWSWTWLAGLLPLSVLAVTLLIGHIRSVGSVEERNRTWLLLGAVAVISPLASTELWADLGYPVVRLGSVGILSFNALLLIAAWQFRLFDRALRPATALTATLLAAVGGIAYLTVFRAAGSNPALLVFGTLTVTLALLASARLIIGTVMQRRDRTVQLVTLGRLAAQMGHDIKNPLAALKGATQFLREERAQGRSIDGRTEFLDLLSDQIDRLQGAAERYQRLGRIQAVRTPTQLNELVHNLVALQKMGNGRAIPVNLDLAGDLPACTLDPDLVAGALENLLQNAFEATRQTAPVTVRTALARNRHTTSVTLSVEDAGVGMSARTLAQALDDFFTTKTTGSGLGLPFVRRVAEAHGGEVSLFSREGVGTTVKLSLPLV